MPGLGETYGDGSSDTVSLAKLGLGFGLLVGGGVILAGGILRVAAAAATSLGAPAPAASRIGLTFALLVLPLALVGLRTRLPRVAGGLPLAAGGGLVGLSIVATWATPTAAGGIGGLALPLALAYAMGVALLSAGVLAGPIAARSRSGRAAGAGSSVGFQRSPSGPGAPGPGPGITPADGGREVDEDLEFPLDEE